MLDLGGNTRLAPVLRPLVASTDGTVRAAFAAIANQGLADVQLDATLPGTRPRELDRRARHDLLALARRRGLTPSGLDCFVPTAHLTAAAPELDRATAALLAAVTLAADLGRLPLSLALPPLDELAPDAFDALLEAADAHAVPLALHAEPQLTALRDKLNTLGSPLVRLGIDAASCLIADHDLNAAAASDIASLRLADAIRDRDRQWQRCPLGQGDLDLTAAYLAAELTPRLGQPVLLDLSRLDNPRAALSTAVRQWHDHAPQLP